MKLILIVYGGADPQLVPTLLDQHHVRGWTRMADAHGAGATGPRAGTRAWPGDAKLFFTAVDAAQAEALMAALRGAAGLLPAGERLHAALMPVEHFF
jgi:hypothetical protein